MRNRMGNQKGQAGAHAEESVIFGHYNRVLECARRHLFPRGIDFVGNTELWQGSAPAGYGDRAWSSAVAVSRNQGGICVQIGLNTTSQLKQHANQRSSVRHF